MPIPSDAINYAEYNMMPFKVFAIKDDKGVVWWRVDDTDIYECSIGDRKMHIDELITQE